MYGNRMGSRDVPRARSCVLGRRDSGTHKIRASVSIWMYRSWVQLDLEILFQIWWMKSKRVHPNRFWNANKMRELQRRHVFDITDWCISIRVPSLVELLLCITAKTISWFCFHWLLKWSKQLFEMRANPAKRKATASEAPSEVKPAKSLCHRWLNEFK